ncbi:XkdX family protein [Enterococcus sp. DIV0733a]
MFSFSDVKMMYDWGCFTEEQVREFVPLCITDEEANKIISKEESAS